MEETTNQFDAENAELLEVKVDLRQEEPRRNTKKDLIAKILSGTRTTPHRKRHHTAAVQQGEVAKASGGQNGGPCREKDETLHS